MALWFKYKPGGKGWQWVILIISSYIHRVSVDSNNFYQNHAIKWKIVIVYPCYFVIYFFRQQQHGCWRSFEISVT